MGLAIWEEEHSDKISTGDMSYPIIFKADPAGDTLERRLYIRHDDLSGNNPESSYGVSVEPVDTSGSDQSSWLQIAPDNGGAPGVYGAAGDSVSLGDVLGGEIKPFWVKLTAPNDPQYGVRSDVKLNLSSTNSATTMLVDLSQGTYSNGAEYLPSNKLDISAKDAEWISGWIDMGALVESMGIIVRGGAGAHVSYRSSSDGTDTTATAWTSYPEDLGAARYIQVRLINSLTVYDGLRRRFYWNTGWSGTPSSTVYGWRPWDGNYGDSYTIRFDGKFYVPTQGTYSFRQVVDDHGYLYIDGSTLLAGGGQTSPNTILTKGWHDITWDFREYGGAAYIQSYITPPGQSERQTQISDFSYFQTNIYDSIQFEYRGVTDQNYDIQLFDGPDVPELISPEDGFDTALFSPELTAYVRNSDEIEWQMDNNLSFSTNNLSQWISSAVPEQNNSSSSPITARPDGVWYWRARGRKNGMFSAWSDHRVLEILPFVSVPEYLYINENIGIETHDPIIDDRFIYLNTNIGLAIHDPIGDDRFLYLNVNVDSGIGKVIYPFKDETKGRKDTFEGDSEYGS